MVWLVAALLLLWMAWGPIVLVVAAALLCVPRLRWWVQDRLWISRRTAGVLAGACVVLLTAVWLVPDGWLPVPPAPGVWAGPSYVGRPATARAVPAEPVQNPYLTPDGSAVRPGPLGLQPEVDTAWLGLERCGRLELTSYDTFVALCHTRSGERLRVVDPETLRTAATRDLPAQPDGATCAGDASYLDSGDRVVVGTGDRRVRAFRTANADGEPVLTEDESWDLKPWIPYRDCLVDVAPDWLGRIWWVSRQGLVGVITPDVGSIAVTDLGEEVGRGLATDEAGAAYVVTEEALHRLGVDPGGSPQVLWRSEYDGSSGSAPVVLAGGVVAVTDTVDDQLGVLFVARESGEQVCRQPVFEKGKGSTDSPLAPLGAGVVVTNNDGYSSPRSTVLCFTSTPGLARVDVVDGGCVVRWTSEAVSPGSGATASWPSGLLYAWTKRPSLTGVSAWYLTAVDAETGRSKWSVRTGTGLLAGSDGSEVALGPEGSAWLGTMAGLVRVRDRVRDRT